MGDGTVFTNELFSAFLITPTNLELKQTDNFEFQLPFILHHVMIGEIKRGKSFGIHFFQEEKHLVEEIIKEPNEKGIWEAKIKIRHHKTNAWVIKQKSSTFFPTNWTGIQLNQKLEEAFLNKKKIKPYKHIGFTSCGIPIAFLFKERIVVSCFPLYD